MLPGCKKLLAGGAIKFVLTTLLGAEMYVTRVIKMRLSRGIPESLALQYRGGSSLAAGKWDVGSQRLSCGNEGTKTGQRGRLLFWALPVNASVTDSVPIVREVWL